VPPEVKSMVKPSVDRDPAAGDFHITAAVEPTLLRQA
jgi:hypothetical protein